VGAEEDGGDLADQPHQPAGGEQQRRYQQPEGVKHVLVVGVAVAVRPHPSHLLPRLGRAGPAAGRCGSGAGRRGCSRCSRGAEGMAVLAVGLAGLGMSGGCLTAARAPGAVEGDQPADDPLRLAAPDAVLLAGPDREGQAVVPHRAGRADGDGLGLELGAVGEERVVVGRHDLEAGGQVAPGASVHAATPPGGHPARAARLAVEASAVGSSRGKSDGVWERLGDPARKSVRGPERTSGLRSCQVRVVFVPPSGTKPALGLGQVGPREQATPLLG
jgi:hypothetical protein